VWRALIRNQGPTDWERVPVPGQPDPHRYQMPWEPRTGLAVALEPGMYPFYVCCISGVLCTKVLTPEEIRNRHGSSRSCFR
jgi:hypothetical protein